tara:strand:- start:1 stop:237 length:237 start_codon:yes stop_codon:yes gene_type:complete
MRNPKSPVKLDIPLFMRLLEFAREDAHSDEELNRVAENVIELSRIGGTLGMMDYELIMGANRELAERKMLQIRAGIIK